MSKSQPTPDLAARRTDKALRALIDKLREVWEKRSQHLSQYEWESADLMLECREDFGDRGLRQVEDEVGIPASTISAYAQCARTYPPSERVAALYFSHHRVCMRLDPADRDRLLGEAVQRGWTKRQLLEAVRALPKRRPAMQEDTLLKRIGAGSRDVSRGLKGMGRMLAVVRDADMERWPRQRRLRTADQIERAHDDCARKFNSLYDDVVATLAALRSEEGRG